MFWGGWQQYIHENPYFSKWRYRIKISHVLYTYWCVYLFQACWGCFQLMPAPCSLARWVSRQDFFVQSDEETDCNSGWGSERPIGVAADVSEWDAFSTRVDCFFLAVQNILWLYPPKNTSLDKVFLLQEIICHTKIELQNLDRWEAYMGLNAFLKFKCKKCHFRSHFQWYLLGL